MKLHLKMQPSLQATLHSLTYGVHLMWVGLNLWVGPVTAAIIMYHYRKEGGM